MNIEEHIRRAIEEGKFDNLPGKGKPLKLDDETHVVPEWRTAHHMLRSAGFSLPWMETRQEIERDIEIARTDLQRTWVWRTKQAAALTPAQVEAEWRRAKQVFTERVEAINKRIFAYNLEAPADQFQKVPLRLEKELDGLQKHGLQKHGLQKL